MSAQVKGAGAAPKSREICVDVFGGESDYCGERYGFLVEDGNLKSLPQPEVIQPLYPFSNAVNAVHFAGTPYVFVFDEEGNFTVYKNHVLFLNGQKLKGGYPFVFYKRDGDTHAICFGDDEQAFIFRDAGNMRSIPLPNSPVCGAYHCGRLFVCGGEGGRTLYWSAPDISSWEEGAELGGSAHLKSDGGAVKSIISYGEKLLILREYGANVLSAFGNSRHFSLRPLIKLTAGVPIPATVQNVDGRVWFCTANGLFSFNGSFATRHNFPSEGEGYKFKSACAFGAEYIVVSATYEGRNVLIMYGVKGDSYSLFGDGCSAVWQQGDGLFCMYGSHLARLTGGSGVWQSVNCDFGTHKIKTLKRIEICGSSTLNIEVTGGGLTKAFRGGDIAPVNLRGTSFSFRVTGEGTLKKITAICEVNV